MRVEFSNLNLHPFEKGCTDSPICDCGENVESIEHFFFNCPRYEDEKLAFIQTTSDISNASSLLSQPAENYVNDSGVEFHWAMKAFHHAETYFNLITAVDPRFLKLTQIDDEIYGLFREQFPDMSVEILEENTMKSKEGKEIWRPFCEQFKGRVEDYNMGTLVRLNASEDISDQNTTLVPRIQFLAIEIARNREGHNSSLRETNKKKTETVTEEKSDQPSAGS